MALATHFLTSIRGFVLQQNGDSLRDWLQVEQSSSAQYHNLAQELRTGFRAGGRTLDGLIEQSLPEEDDVAEGRGSPWPGFVSFMKEYLHYWRDVDFNDPVVLYERLSGLLT